MLYFSRILKQLESFHQYFLCMSVFVKNSTDMFFILRINLFCIFSDFFLSSVKVHEVEYLCVNQNNIINQNGSGMHERNFRKKTVTFTACVQ